MNLKQFAKDVHKNAVDKGWWVEERSFGELIALAHSELSEALEEYRSGHEYTEVYTVCRNCTHEPKQGYNCSIGEICHNWEKRDKPEGIPIEMADAIIRILDACEFYGIDIERALELKHEYNLTRPYRHGGKVI